MNRSKQYITDKVVDKQIKRMADGAWISIPKIDEDKTKLKSLSHDEFIKQYNEDKITVLSFNDDLFITENKVFFRDEKNSKFDEDIEGINEKTMPFGMYNVEPYRPRYVKLVSKVINKDQYINLNDETATEIYADIDKFIGSGDKYKAAGILKKRGILLFGPPGNGKTMIINHVVDKYKEKARILFLVDPGALESGLMEDWKSHFSEDLTIFVIEELTQYCSISTDVSSMFLSFLDGQYSWDNCLVIATTNYPERLPGNLVDRPSRFDRIIRVDVPSQAARRKYLEKMLGEGNVSDFMIKKTEGFSIAYIKEICVQMMIHGKSFDEIVKESQLRKENIKRFFCDVKMENGQIYE